MEEGAVPVVLWEQRRAHISAEPSWMIWIGRPGALRNILDGVPEDFWPKINEQMFVQSGCRGVLCLVTFFPMW